MHVNVKESDVYLAIYQFLMITYLMKGYVWHNKLAFDCKRQQFKDVIKQDDKTGIAQHFDVC